MSTARLWVVMYVSGPHLARYTVEFAVRDCRQERARPSTRITRRQSRWRAAFKWSGAMPRHCRLLSWHFDACERECLRTAPCHKSEPQASHHRDERSASYMEKHRGAQEVRRMQQKRDGAH